MANLLSSVNLALSALLSHQQSVQVNEHNVANVNTPGYRRQSAVLSAGPAVTLSNSYYGTGIGQMGSGVYVSQIQRFAIDFYDSRYRAEKQESMKWSTERNILRLMESVMAETSTDGMLPKLDAFFKGWQALADNPTDMSVRRELLDSAKALASAINSRSIQIESIRSEQDLAIKQRVQEINQLSSQIAGLNREIARVFSVGDSPNDLLDARDSALDRLSELAGAASFRQENGEILVSIAGHILVGGQESYDLSTEMDPTNESLSKIVWADGKQLIPSTGELAGLLEARDIVINKQRAGLNQLSSTLRDSVNAIHNTGFGLDGTTGENFFVGIDAGSLKVNSLLNSVEKIGASSQLNEPGNNEIAQALFKLRTSTAMSTNTATFNQFYNDLVSSLGLSVKRATINANDRELVSQALSMQRESVSGVSLNEEAANIVKSQKAYEAAARLMSTIDSMLDTVINRMGAGR